MVLRSENPSLDLPGIYCFLVTNADGAEDEYIGKFTNRGRFWSHQQTVRSLAVDAYDRHTAGLTRVEYAVSP